MRKRILGNQQQEAKVLEQLLGFQRQGYEGIYKAVDGLPVTIRLSDPRLHEFLPFFDDEETWNH